MGGIISGHRPTCNRCLASTSEEQGSASPDPVCQIITSTIHAGELSGPLGFELPRSVMIR